MAKKKKKMCVFLASYFLATMNLSSVSLSLGQIQQQKISESLQKQWLSNKGRKSYFSCNLLSIGGVDKNISLELLSWELKNLRSYLNSVWEDCFWQALFFFAPDNSPLNLSSLWYEIQC